MEQFYHYLSFNGMALPTDFRMPSIEGFRPRTSVDIPGIIYIFHAAGNGLVNIRIWANCRHFMIFLIMWQAPLHII